MAKFMSAPPVSQSPGMAIEKNPYASDEVGGYNMFSGDYEQTRDSLWSRLIKVLRDSGQPAPPKQEFDQYYDSTMQSSGGGGNPLFDPEMTDDLRSASQARMGTYQPGGTPEEKSASEWKRILDSIKSMGPTPAPGRASMEDSAPIPEPDIGTKPLTADYGTREEYEAALREWEMGQGYLD